LSVAFLNSTEEQHIWPSTNKAQDFNQGLFEEKIPARASGWTAETINV
jgi:hypothetical protein